ncbi:DNA polymerase kappa subunit [Cladophialophora psammophila CBS 110553]|uniref:DNA polymerase kappa n=1 Tax=Cladophialophora psammophila CBS 110553 TaxID=1182543 RepID=W9XF51_9EURO|nr:DNA polymerase kappa subunit [Cladophialophora psammophila CBS 110553]EXJ75965.1 DNA polymerase kappa subunit [Cladophialophora psammophila CBS 110553]
MTLHDGNDSLLTTVNPNTDNTPDDQGQTPRNQAQAAFVQASQHHSLKHHLLGPSLTKAGQDAVDQKKVSEIIYEASKGSKFFNNEEVKDRNLTVKIEQILKKKAQLEKLDLKTDLRRADDYIASLELARDLSQYVVHIDCDAFYAAVEEIDRPELKTVPMAVGMGVLTTCNYEARKYGCRSAMAAFVAKKLCPQLVCLPLNFDKYTAKAKEVRAILAEYDPRFESSSIDEAYMNITGYCNTHRLDPEAAVEQLRKEVHEKCKITISAGIAPNAKLAKICSNKNKPNGQFRIPNDRAAIMSFMAILPVRKVNGVGRVFERELDAIGIKTCGDIYLQRAYLYKLFGEKAFQFLMHTYLGLGRTIVQPAEEYERKSVGTESTFRDIRNKQELREKLRRTAEELAKDMIRVEVKGRTLVLKVKLHTYEVFTRQVATPKAVHLADDLYNYSLPMLVKLEKEIPDFRLRLMGLRCTHLVSTKKGSTDFFRRKPSNDNSFTGKSADDAKWEVWPDSEFEEAARQERQEEIEELERLSQEQQHEQTQDQDTHTPVPDASISTADWHEPFGRYKFGSEPTSPAASPPAKHGRVLNKTASSGLNDEHKQEAVWDCPICQLPQPANDREFNSHIDLCLSRQTIKEVVAEAHGSTLAGPSRASPDAGVPDRPRSANGMKAKRKVSSSNLAGPDVAGGRRQKRLFFT